MRHPESEWDNHLQVYCCPACRGDLAASQDRLQCGACNTIYRREEGSFNFAPEIPRRSVETQPSQGQRWMEEPDKVKNYEAKHRVHYVRTMGKTRFRSFTPDVEDAYLIANVDPISDGRILDVACGTGRWTRTLVERIGPDRVIGFDLSCAMLALARGRLPSTTLVRGSALNLPFEDDSLGAINCWNAIQALPDPQRAILEMGRVLKPGGTFTCLTYLTSPGPYRLIQAILQRCIGSIVVKRSVFFRWIEAADLTVQNEMTVGQVLMLTARRR